VNYYEHHLGDYLRDTAHLSVIEDGVYRRLLDQYYIREKPLPGNVKDCCKMARSVSRPEREAVAYVLREFFVLQDDGYHQARADGEIARFKDKSAKAKIGAAASVESRRRTASEIRSARMTAARAAGTHTRDEWALLMEVCGAKCVRCGAGGHLDRDHIQPVYQGGSDSIDNIQPLCARCNASKGPENVDHRPANWRQTFNEMRANAQRSLNGRSTLQSPVSNLQSPDSNTDSEKRKRPPASRASALPPDFDLTIDRKAYADKTLPNVDAAELMAAFRDYHASKGTTAKDWDASWRTYVRNGLKFGYPMPIPSREPTAKIVRIDPNGRVING